MTSSDSRRVPRPRMLERCRAVADARRGSRPGWHGAEATSTSRAGTRRPRDSHARTGGSSSSRTKASTCAYRDVARCERVVGHDRHAVADQLDDPATALDAISDAVESNVVRACGAAEMSRCCGPTVESTRSATPMLRRLGSSPAAAAIASRRPDAPLDAVARATCRTRVVPSRRIIDSAFAASSRPTRLARWLGRRPPRRAASPMRRNTQAAATPWTRVNGS